MPGRFSLYQDMTVEENLNFFATVFNTTIEENYHLVEDIYKQIEPFKKRKAGKLSGGMKQKFLIALAFGRASKAMIFDEPTANLDPSAREHFKTLLHNHAKDKSLIFISHRLEEVGGLVNRMICMDLGRIIDDKNV